jgi:hypothetical protein
VDFDETESAVEDMIQNNIFGKKITCFVLSKTSSILQGIFKLFFMDNPFIIKGYTSKELFCNREKELQIL